MEVFTCPLCLKSNFFSNFRLHDYNTGRKFEDQINIQGFAVGNGCTHETECEFLSDYGPYLMQLYRDSGFITSEMYNEVDAKCNNKKVLPDDCTALLDKVFFFIEERLMK
jgi:hypothetical protein